MLFTLPPPNYNNRAKITNTNSNSFTNLINRSYLFSILFIYLFTYFYFDYFQK